MGHGSRHRRPAQGRRHGRTQDGRQVAPTTPPGGAVLAPPSSSGPPSRSPSAPGSPRSWPAPPTRARPRRRLRCPPPRTPTSTRNTPARTGARHQAHREQPGQAAHPQLPEVRGSGRAGGRHPRGPPAAVLGPQPASAVELHAVADTGWNAMSMTMRNAPAVGAVVATAKPAARQKSLDFDLTGVVKGNGTYSFALVAPRPARSPRCSPASTAPTVRRSRWTGPAPPGTPAPAPPRPPPPSPGLPSMSPLPPSPTRQAGPDLDQQLVRARPRRRLRRAARCSAPACGPVTARTPRQALDPRDRRAFGRPDIVRTYYPGMPAAWPGSAGVSGGPVAVSFKAAPKDVMSGRLDGPVRATGSPPRRRTGRSTGPTSTSRRTTSSPARSRPRTTGRPGCTWPGWPTGPTTRSCGRT